MNKNILITIVLVIIVGAAGFFGGMQYQKSQATTSIANGGQFQGQRVANGQGRFGARRGFGGATIGQIVSMDADSITVKLQDGSSKIVNISDSTTFSKSDTAAKSDIKTGDRVAAFGSANSDGSVTAQTIQINPTMPRAGGSPVQTQ